MTSGNDSPRFVGERCVFHRSGLLPIDPRRRRFHRFIEELTVRSAMDSIDTAIQTLLSRPIGW